MGRYQKTFTLKYMDDSDCAATRMVERLRNAEEEGRGVPLKMMRLWMQAGFLLEEIGQGLCDSVLTMDREGVFRSMNHSQQSEVLIKLIEHKVWQYKLMESAKNQDSPVTPTFTPTQEPEAGTDREDEPEPDPTTQKTAEDPPRRKKRRVAPMIA